MSNMSDFVIENGVLKKYTGAGGDVVIPDGVTSIGDNVFRACRSLKSVSIPNSVTKISSWSFADCYSLENVTIPNSAQTIGDFAFYNCWVLSGIIIPNGVTSLGTGAFFGCKKLQHITISNNMTSIGPNTFQGCESLQAITIPNSVVSIGKDAFFGCTNLQSIEAPCVPLTAFDTNIKSALVRGFAVASKQGRLFAEEQSTKYLKYIKAQRKKLYNTAIQETALLHLMMAEKMLQNDDVEAIINLSGNDPVISAALLEYQNQNLKPVDIEEQFDKEIKEAERQAERDAAFSASGVLSVADAKKAWQYEKKKDGTILIKAYKGTDLKAAVPTQIGKDPVTEIGDYAFSPEQPGVLTKIKEQRQNITAVSIPDCVKKIGCNAFTGCAGLADSAGFVIVRDILYSYYGSGEDAAIPDSVKIIGDTAFSGCSGLTHITIPDKVTDIGKEAFKDCKNLQSVIIPRRVKRISGSLFEGCERLENVTIPSGVTKIGDLAFHNCYSLKSIALPANVKRLEDRVFSCCYSLTEITVPDGVTQIGESAFWGCSSLTSVSIPDSVTEIGEKAFKDCTKLQSITIPEGVRNIGCYVFRDCTSLASVTLPNSLTSIGDSAFYGHGELTIHAPTGSYAEAYAKKHKICIVSE